MRRVAFLGLGIMGSRMAARLLDAGFGLTVWNRTPERTEPLRARGAQVAESPAAATQGVDAAVTMLGDPDSVRDVALSRGGLVEGLAPGAIYVDMTTVDPGLSRALDCACRPRGVTFLDAPVTGSKTAADKGELVVMVGGPSEGVERVRPLFTPLAKHVVHMGPVGAGALMKLANNLAIAGSMLALFEALLLGRSGQLRDGDMLDVLTHGALASPLLALKGTAVSTGDFEPHFAFKHMAKDMRLAVEEAGRHELHPPLAALVHSLFAKGLEDGYAEEDFAALIKVVGQWL